MRLFLKQGAIENGAEPVGLPYPPGGFDFQFTITHEMTVPLLDGETERQMRLMGLLAEGPAHRHRYGYLTGCLGMSVLDD